MRLYLCLWLLVWPVSAVSQDDRASTNSAMLIRIAAEDNWPPFSDEQGKGLSEQLVKAAFATQGYQISTVVVPYARALYFTSKGDTDACWNVTRQLSTERDFILHKTPLFSADSSFYCYQQCKTDPLQQLKFDPLVFTMVPFRRHFDHKRRTHENS
ncbi:MAG: hypothetical protein KJ556_14915, partial [Gammaproteobacteria bacterium]|nr:hypothetical protein [Gammaproteobacteria bacterium]MBU2246707.1 hypothetical protein [Gammaproteobacteria bacterium]